MAVNQLLHTMIKDQVTSVVGEMEDGEGNPTEINEPVLEKLKEDINRDLKQTTHTEHEATAAVNIGGTTAPEPPADWVTVMRKELSSMVNQKVETGKSENNVILFRYHAVRFFWALMTLGKCSNNSEAYSMIGKISNV